jgi:hypothetical protein
MSSFDGSGEPLKYGHALAMLADKASWGSEEQRREVIDAILKEHGLWVEPVAPDDPHAAFVFETNKELRELRELAAKLQADKDARDQADEVAKLKAQIAGFESGSDAPAAAGAGSVARTDYTEMTVAQLRSRLLARELPVGGTKDELVARLEEADKA